MRAPFLGAIAPLLFEKVTPTAERSISNGQWCEQQAIMGLVVNQSTIIFLSVLFRAGDDRIIFLQHNNIVLYILYIKVLTEARARFFLFGGAALYF